MHDRGSERSRREDRTVQTRSRRRPRVDPLLLALFLAVPAAVAGACGGADQVLSGSGGSMSTTGTAHGGSGGAGNSGSGAGPSSSSSTISLSSGTGGAGGTGSVNSNYPCAGCMAFPPSNAPACTPATLGPPTIAYPLDGLLLPPNMNVLEVQFVPPAGATLFEVDFDNAITSVKVETMCNAITPVRGGPSPGCGVTLPQAAWNDIANTNRDGDPVTVTVRATIDGTCVSTSTAQIRLSFAKDDIVGGIYYWQSATYGGIGGKTGGIYSHDFGSFDPTPTPFYTSGASGTCVGCHFLSRDGVRMSLAFDDPDADDEFGDVHTVVLDVASRSAVGGMMMSPGFQSWAHDHSKMVASTYKMGMNKSFAVFDQNGATTLATDTLPTMGMTSMKGTQPSLSADDGTLVFVVPSTVSGFGISMAGDHHFFGGSLYLSTFNPTTNALGAPSMILASTGTPPNATNFYYPDIAPDGSFVLFNAAPNGDAFYNPNARVQLIHLPAQAGAQPIDLPALNVADNLTNSWPRWSPVVQTYKGKHILWVTFSSNRDYGLRLTNGGFPNCYPPESPMYDMPQPLSKQGVGYEGCAEPQIWMAGVIVDPDPSLDAGDRSFPAFWLPFQDVTSHNHSAQWVQQIQGGTGGADGGTDGGAGGAGGGSGGTCGEAGALCGGSNALCCTDMICCNGTCQPACVQ
jgi:hypothetical protein